ncbi:selenocysteine-specific translation elongation factor SelB [Sulfitobacter marinus]|uniref:Selenocysteine-specific translation elongation factor SelB n=1 Tax=Sulfitobacter marinus TaxID=394264 RepID=A0A1I6U6P5_9RHOB|nr:selenocysteine-specific translation elongation factor [Sulfitobacter marinus]SFS97085.1 selenocysteine-specific translation elongation factor SelB [Sulfitobacter marinus]
MTSACVIVIGHVDHGKTTLVRRLTGMETDTLAQEKQRGLSINLGFAYCRYPSGIVDLIDAPGHEDFIRAMVAGATGAQAALLVVSAVDGIAAQTLEHLRIAKLLGVPVRFVAVTKCDVQNAGDLNAGLATIRDGLNGLGLGDVPIIPVAADSEAGIQSLHHRLKRLLAEVPKTQSHSASFLPVDRVFTVQGMGTVVTGTLLGGDLAVSDAITLHPHNRPVTIRGLQSRGAARERVTHGERTAVNLRGIAAEEITRGDVLAAGGLCAPSSCMDVELTLLPDAPKPVKHMSDVRVLFGTTHAVATLRLMGGGQVEQGCAAFAQLRFGKPVTGYAGQRMIVRSLSPADTIGGAVILDPFSTGVKSGDKKRLAVMQATSGGDVLAIAHALCAQGRGSAMLAYAARIAQQSEARVLSDLGTAFEVIGRGEIAPAQAIADAQNDLLAKLKAFHAAHPLKRYAPRGEMMNRALSPLLGQFVENSLAVSEDIRIAEGQIGLASYDPAAVMTPLQKDRMVEIETQLRDGGTTPPGLSEIVQSNEDADLVEVLIASQSAVAMVNVGLNQQLVFHTASVSDAAHALREVFPPPTRFTTSQAREALNTSRKFIVPLLEYFDAAKVTQRDGDLRVMAGPAD